jgi:UDP-3-O-[3-hydroxymyristoyl] glucosamine N-acyltransferase
LAEALSLSGIVGVITTASLASKIPEQMGCLLSDDPVLTAYEIHRLLVESGDHYWTDFPSRVASSAIIGPGVQIAEKNVIIGENAVIEPNAVISERSLIGDDAHVGATSVIGATAFELIKKKERNLLYPHAGGARLGDGAIVLSGTMIVKSVFAAFTEIRENVVVDNLVHVAHDCDLAPGTRVVACVLLGGRAVLGANCYIGPNATVSNGVTVGDSAVVSLGATVTRDVPAGERVSGNFAISHEKFLANLRESR